MKSVIPLILTSVIVIVLAFNPHIIAGPIHSALNDLKNYHGQPNRHSIPALHPIKMPDRAGEMPSAELMRPGADKKDPIVKSFGAGAVAIQKAQGL